jgi:hypothetical protein
MGHLICFHPQVRKGTPTVRFECFTAETVYIHSVLSLLVIVNILPSSPIFVTLMIEAIHSTEMSILTRAILRNIPEDDILHSHCSENIKSYIALTGWAL